MISCITVLCIVCMLVTINDTQTKNKNYLVNLSDDSQRIFKQPNGPYAVIFFNQYAHGNYIGLVYYNTMDSVLLVDAPWGYSKRFWQDEEWCSDVNNFAWSFSGKYLYIATSIIYGSGKLFELDLFNKKSRAIWPSDQQIKKLKGEYIGTYITSIDSTNQQMKVMAKSDKETINSEIKMK